MFVILNIAQSGKRKIRRGKTVKNVRDVFTGSGERFYIVDVYDSEKGVNWDEVSYFIGKHSKNVLMTRSFDFPEFSPVKRFEPKRFVNVLLLNTVEIILREMYLSGVRVRCIVNDSDGSCASGLSKIARFSAQTTVITKNEFRYFAEIKNIYSQFGAGITVTEKTVQADEKTFIIDLSGDFEYTGTGYLFSADRQIIPFAVDGFQYLKSLCPQEINQIDFLGAVYEFNHDKSLEDAFCRSFLYNDEKRTVTDLICEIEENLSGCERNKNIIFYV